jgi:preprotein translocase subunit SecG
MTIIFILLIVAASAILGLIVLIQNPKGGGLSGNIAGFSNQFMGVKQTTDVLEKGTWIFAAVIALLCMFSVIFISKTTTSNSGPVIDTKQLPIPSTSSPNSIPANSVPLTPSNNNTTVPANNKPAPQH